MPSPRCLIREIVSVVRQNVQSSYEWNILSVKKNHKQTQSISNLPIIIIIFFFAIFTAVATSM